MASTEIRLKSVIHRASGSVVVVPHVGAITNGNDVDRVLTLASEGTCRQVVIGLRTYDLRSPWTSDLILPSLLTQLRTVGKQLILFIPDSAGSECIRGAGFPTSVGLASSSAELKQRYNVDLSLRDSLETDDDVSFTAEELRQMEADGLTLSDAIRAIESRLG